MTRYRHEHITIRKQPDATLSLHRPYRYGIICRATGIGVSFHETYAAAKDTLDLYRMIDRRDGNYTPGHYVIRPVTLAFLKHQQERSERLGARP